MASNKTPRTRYRLDLEALPSDVPPERRQAQVLKGLLRAHGFRCVMASELPVEPKPEPKRTHR